MKNKDFFLLGFFLGGFLGAVVLFFLGTKKGRQLTQVILEKAELFEENIEEKIDNLQPNGRPLVS